MTALLAMPTTVASLLGAHHSEVLSGALHRAGVAERVLVGTPQLPSDAGRVLDERVGEVLHRLLDIDIGELVVDGWAERMELADAVLRTRVGRAAEEVRLGDHRITSTHHPTVDVLAGGSPITALRFELVITLRLRRVVAVVRGGLLVDVQAGHLTADAVLALDDEPLIGATGRGTVGALLRLGDGLLLPGPWVAHPRPVERGARATVLPMVRRTGEEPAP
ncbi:hypothetical protein [Pseudonocardia humida]|uniref:Uncharacterized protein n=1 Tax=Pseudonocardia humida TaxID=2800819 RepID=A0ABT0ZWV1_9PSEU|nr:hypothetical protein [Pseudonocardia humida]MCO1655223.1 hypothetical protein [Pseudonocardia humida]